MAQEFPLLKLGGLLVKTLAKPMSKRIKHEFSRYEFTQNLLVGIGQGTHAITSRMTIWSAGYKVRSIHPLEREDALSRGAEFVGESFIFLVAGTVLVLEYNRNREKERLLEQARHQELVQETEKLIRKLTALDERLVLIERNMVSQKHDFLSLENHQTQSNIDQSSDNQGVAMNDDTIIQNEETHGIFQEEEKRKIWWWPF